jgi:uncharacterized SAM-binding protein YcdF (DUF218 family)
MFFILSKTLNFLTLPFTLICIVFIASAIVRNVVWKKRLFVGALGATLLLSNDFLANEAMRAWEVRAVPYDRMGSHDVGIVLTGATISGLEPKDRVYFQRGADRVTHTVQLYKSGLLKKILISGGTGALVAADEPEADKFRKVMLMMGVDDGDIIIENDTRNTHESAVRVKVMLDSLQVPPENCLLITSAFHMRRSLACYRKVGMSIETFSTDFYAHPRSFYPDVLLIPKIEAMYLWQKLFKEWAGLFAYKMAGYV